MASEKQTRREWLSAVPAAAAVASAATPQTTAGVNRPNIVLVISDQFRWDCIGAMGLNPMNLTPNLDAMAARGVLFRPAISNQPVCAPARASIFTGQYPGRHGVWKQRPRLEAEDATTLATVMQQAGYSTNYIGKWHLARPEAGTAAETRGAVKAGHRGGFLDLWEAANALELTSHAYEGDLFDTDSKPIHFSGSVSRRLHDRTRAQLFLRSAQIAVPADGLLPGSPSPERQRHLRSAERVRRAIPQPVHTARICGRCPGLGPARSPITSPASPKWTKPWAPCARRWRRPAWIRTQS